MRIHSNIFEKADDRLHQQKNDRNHPEQSRTRDLKMANPTPPIKGVLLKKSRHELFSGSEPGALDIDIMGA